MDLAKCVGHTHHVRVHVHHVRDHRDHLLFWHAHHDRHGHLIFWHAHHDHVHRDHRALRKYIFL